jgi:hypothetical protein
MNWQDPAHVFEAAAEANADDLGVLTRPLEAFSVLHDFEDIFDIVQWWWFNPLGSTMCALRLFDFMPLKSRLVTVAQYHERSREITVYAAGPRAKLVDLRTLAPVIERVFSRYGYAHLPKFLPHLPTGIDLRQLARSMPMLVPVLEDGFLAAARNQTRSTVLRACRFMESYPNDPFERTKHEVLEAMGESPSGDAARGAESGGDGPPTDDDLQRWWNLVTDAQHVEIERELVLRG